jgi:predicted site-specific integrase-resolvase
MLIDTSWYTPEDAEAKFGIDKSLILEWVAEGLVRCETEKGKVVRVNVDDLELKLEDRARS